MLPNQTEHSHRLENDENTVIYSEVKKEAITKKKEAAQTAEEMQRDEGELADQSDKMKRVSTCMCIIGRVLPNCLYSLA